MTTTVEMVEITKKALRAYIAKLGRRVSDQKVNCYSGEVAASFGIFICAIELILMKNPKGKVVKVLKSDIEEFEKALRVKPAKEPVIPELALAEIESLRKRNKDLAKLRSRLLKIIKKNGICFTCGGTKNDHNRGCAYKRPKKK